MKNYLLILIISITLVSCNNHSKNENRNISLGDTINTPSGLKYIFLKQGKGIAIQRNSKVEVYADLYLNETDTIFWSTSTEKDSIFRFIHGHTPVIKGFYEVHEYLVEGDEIIAIIPDSLGYGKTGGNGMPPAATLIYNPLIVKKVSEPKKLINDTLQSIVTEVDAKAAINFYENTVTSEQKDYYHTEIDLIFTLLDSISDKNLFSEIEDLSLHFEKKSRNKYDLQLFAYYKMLAQEKQGNINDALAIVEKQLEKEDRWSWWLKKSIELKEKLDSISGE